MDSISPRRIAIATLMSDLQLMGKVPHGRLDVLEKTQMPEDVEQTIDRRVAGKSPDKGTVEWRRARHFFLELRPLGTRKPLDPNRPQADPEERAARRGPVGFAKGVVHMKKYVVKALYDAGTDLARDCGDEDVSGYESDLAVAVLSGLGVRPDQFSSNAWTIVVSAAADHCSEGIDKVKKAKAA